FVKLRSGVALACCDVEVEAAVGCSVFELVDVGFKGWVAFPTRRSSDLERGRRAVIEQPEAVSSSGIPCPIDRERVGSGGQIHEGRGEIERVDARETAVGDEDCPAEPS